MRNLRRKSAGGPIDGITAPRNRAGRAFRPLALACFALAATVLSGCQSGPCGGLSPCTSGLWNGMKNGVASVTNTVRDTTAKVFHHKKGGCSTCGDGSVEGMPVEGQVISGGVVPGPVVAPPANESAPTILEPAAPAGNSGSGAATKGKSSSSVGPATLNNVGNKQAAVYRGRSIESNSVGRGENLARAALLPSAAPSAGGSITARKVDSKNPLDNVPPVDLSDEVARQGKTLGVPVEAELIKNPTPAASVDKTATSSVPPVPVASADDAELPAIKAGIQTSRSADIKHFSSVKPKINGGSFPSGEGLAWLKDRGIRTLVDLREPSEVDPKFVEVTKSLGFRYVSLPVNPSKLDAATLTRFADEIHRAEGQPVYFFDKDGDRAGVAWYLHRLTVDKVDAQIASREAEELGLTDKATWVAAAKFIDAAKTAAQVAAPAKPQVKTAAPALAIPSPTSKPTTAPATSSTSAWGSSTAALIMTGLTAPVVEWTSTVINVSREDSASRSAEAR